MKYFSGTALYKNSFHIENNDMSKNRAYLNLGKVGDIATVKLNGEEVGIYWKAPYISDITDYLKEGKNILEVSVTNLWVNRLIGDEKLPPEERKTETNLRNIEGRYSFERFAQPDGDKYLRYSGLMGPVKIQFSRIYDMHD
ncbi:MAG: glycosylhydrolase-like jelly roll fold domain-containing protein [Cyclobacteriaceae bacterium]